MPIIAKCSCGNRIGLGDAMAGRTIRCPKCGGDVLVVAAAAGPVSKKPARGTAASPASVRKPSGGVLASSVSVSPTVIVAAIVGGLLLAIGLSLYFGPWRVSNQWAEMAPKANDQVTDVVQYGIQTYLAQQGMYDPMKSHMTPVVDGPITFIAPLMCMSMPQRIVFRGKTNQGNFVGTYDTTNGEVVADVEVGGYSFGGLVDIRKASGKFHMTGREKNSKVTAESNGTPLVMPVYTPGA